MSSKKAEPEIVSGSAFYYLYRYTYTLKNFIRIVWEELF